MDEGNQAEEGSRLSPGELAHPPIALEPSAVASGRCMEQSDRISLQDPDTERVGLGFPSGI